MGKSPAKKKPTEGSVQAEPSSRTRSARGLLIAAVALSVTSLGGGFFLARMAFESDARDFEPDYVEIAQAETEDTGIQVSAAGSDVEEEENENEGFLEFEDIVTNLNIDPSEQGAARSFLKLSVILVYRPDPGARQLMEARQPFMRDLFTTFARSLTEAEIRGAAGLIVIKSELLKRARAATGNNLPQDVLIRDIVIQ